MKTLSTHKTLGKPAAPAAQVLYLMKEAPQLNAGVKDESGVFAKAIRGVRLTGPKTLYQSAPNTPVAGVYTIDNYDSFTTYTVSVSAGSVSVNGKTITLTSPSSPGTVTLTVNGEPSKVVIKAACVLPSTISYPTPSLKNVSISCSVTSSAFAVSSGTDTCLRTEWRVSPDPTWATGVLNFSSVGDALTKTLSGLAYGTRYYLQTRHVGTTYGAADWSESVIFETKLKDFASVETQKVTPLPAVNGMQYASAVALSADATYLFVGALFGQTVSKNVGGVYVYRQSGGVWALKTILVPSDGEVNDGIGKVVVPSADGSVVMIGASGDDDKGSNAGAVHLFTRQEETWSLGQKITLPTGVAGDELGRAIAINSTGDLLFIGVPGQLSAKGAVVLYTRNVETGRWMLTTTLTAGDGAAGDGFGQQLSVTTDGKLLAVSAPSASMGGLRTGAVYLFAYEAGTWSQKAKLSPAAAVAGDLAGEALVIDSTGTWLFVQMANKAVSGVSAGTVTVFKRVNDVWSEKQTLSATDYNAGQKFGSRLAINEAGTRLIVGAKGDTANKGAFYLYELESGSWVRKGKWTGSVVSSAAQLGDSLSIDRQGVIAIVGAPYDASQIANGGSAFLFS